MGQTFIEEDDHHDTDLSPISSESGNGLENIVVPAQDDVASEQGDTTENDLAVGEEEEQTPIELPKKQKFNYLMEV